MVNPNKKAPENDRRIFSERSLFIFKNKKIEPAMNVMTKSNISVVRLFNFFCNDNQSL